MFLALSGTIAAVYLYSQMNDRLRLHAAAELSKAFPSLEVYLGGAELEYSKKIVLRDIVFYAPASDGSGRRKVFQSDTCILNCPISIEKFLNDELEIQSLEVKSPKLFLTRDQNGKIVEFDLLRDFRSDKKSRPPVDISDGYVEVDGVIFRNIDASLTPNEIAQIPGIQEDWTFSLRAAANDWFHSIRLTGKLDIATEQLIVDGSVEQFRLSRQVWDFLYSWKPRSNDTSRPDPQSTVFNLDTTLKSLKGDCNATFQLVRDSKSPLGFRGKLEGKLDGGRADVNLFKKPFNDVQFDFRITDRDLLISNCCGNNGESEVSIEYWQPEIRNTLRSSLKIETKKITVDIGLIDRLSPFIPRRMSTFLEKFHNYSMYADINTVLTRNGNQWTPRNFTLHATDLAFIFGDSAYRIEGLVGNLNLDQKGDLSFKFDSFEPDSIGLTDSIPVFDSLYGNSQTHGERTGQPAPAAFVQGSRTIARPSTNSLISSRFSAISPEIEPKQPENELSQKTEIPKRSNKSVNIEGSFANVLSEPNGNITVRASGIPINAKLMSIIPEKSRRVIQSLHPEGSVNVFVSLGLPKEPGLEITKKFVIGAENCSIVYDAFPYPVRDINGVIEWDGDDWVFSNFTGTNESTKVRANGDMKQSDDGYVLKLFFDVDDLPLEGRIGEALLNSGHKELYTSLRGTGKVNVDAQVWYFPSTKRLDVSFEAEPDHVDGITICPKSFPVRIEDVHGQIRFNNGNFSVRSMRGRNKETEFTSEIDCTFNRNGSWEMNIVPITIDRISIKDPDLLKALPENMQILVRSIKPEGAINMDGGIRFYKQESGLPLNTEWNLSLTLHQNSADIGVPVHDIFGRVHLVGRNEERKSISVAGELELDSVIFNDMQISKINGPFHYDGNRIILGQNIAVENQISASNFRQQQIRGQQPAKKSGSTMSFYGQSLKEVSSRTNNVRSRDFDITDFGNRLESEQKRLFPDAQPQIRPISASLFGGTAYCQGRVDMNQNSISYRLQMDLVQAKLEQAAKELRGSVLKDVSTAPKNVSGKLNISTNIYGEGKNPDTLSGNGFITLSDAYLYESPTMIKLLQRLSIQEPDKSAFSSGEIQFRIQGKKLLLNSVKLDGKALSLAGNGELLLDTKRINLILKTKFEGTKKRLPIIGDLIGGASEQLNEVHVEGPAENPEITIITLPGMRNAIEQIQSDIKL